LQAVLRANLDICEVNLNPQRDELTVKMHSEFSVSKETEVKLRAGCVWSEIYFDYKNDDFILTEEQIRKIAKTYCITYYECMQHKEYWKQIIIKNRK
jgi:hypothetical protein